MDGSEGPRGHAGAPSPPRCCPATRPQLAARVSCDRAGTDARTVTWRVQTAIYCELRHVKNKKIQPTKYWAFLSCENLVQGSPTLQVYKAPVEYCFAKQRLQPKNGSRLSVTLSAA